MDVWEAVEDFLEEDLTQEASSASHEYSFALIEFLEGHEVSTFQINRFNGVWKHHDNNYDVRVSSTTMLKGIKMAP